MPEASPGLNRSESALKEAFHRYESGISLGNARRAAVIAAVFMFAGWSLDWVVVPSLEWEFLLIRAICVFLLAVVFILLGHSSASRHAGIFSQGVALFPLIAICVMIAITDGGNSIYYAGLNLVLVGLSLLLRWTFWNSLGMIALCLLFYSISVLVCPVEPDFRILFNNAYFLFVTSVFVLAGSLFYERLRFTEFKLRDEVEQAKQLLESQNRQLSELDEAKTRFFANISHELRTPLTVMLGITERLRSAEPGTRPPDEESEMIGMLEQNGLRLLKLIDDLLDLVRFDTGHADINRQPTEIAAHIDGLLRSLRHLAEQDKVGLLWKCNDPSARISIDRDKFDKILLNLVINAIKFTPSGGSIEVRLDVKDGMVVLAVEDTGVGIPPEVLPRIFERFWQVATSSTRKFQGAGIGLALVRSLTEAMDGTVTVDSRLGHGTCFNVNIPAPVVAEGSMTDDARPDPLEDGGKIARMHRQAAMSIPGRTNVPAKSRMGPHEPLAAAPTIGRPSSLRPLVLVADDEPDIRKFLRMQMEGVDVIEAADGAEALELARIRHPQLALLDHMMPEMDGVEVCRAIRKNHATRATAVIILTARADEKTKLAALEAGANDFLTKPFSSAELALRLENQIAMARIRREMADLNLELHSALERIKENEVLMIRNEKLSALGRMSAGIIHEINNPLNYAGAGIHALETFTRSLPQADQADFSDILRDIREGVERVSQIVIDLRKFTREDKSIAGEADLVDVVQTAHRMLSHQFGKNVTFDFEAPGSAVIQGNSNQLVQVFINFFQNSMDAIAQRIAENAGPEGKITVTLEHAGDGWFVVVRDNGIGIPPENLPKIFDPFFTSKDVGRGMGLGLSITHQILRSHGAHVEVDSRPGEYTVFRIHFPTRVPEDRQSVLDRADDLIHDPDTHGT